MTVLLFSDQDTCNIIQLYSDGYTENAIAKQYNCSQTFISCFLKKHNVVKRIGKNIVYTDINVNFFSKIDTEEKAYFLGFMYADGCVSTDNQAYTASIKLIKSDINIIEKFRDIMSPSSPIRISDDKYAYFKINRKEICNQLINLGCTPRKSLTLQFPNLDEHLVRHFIRGYSDGDGSIYYTTVGLRKDFAWKIISTDKFCQTVSCILKKILNINCHVVLSKPNSSNQITTTLSVGGSLQLRKVLDWLYQDSSIYLKRKYEKYLEFNLQIENNHLQTRFSERGGFLIDKDKVIDLYINNGLSKRDVAKQMNCDEQSVKNILKKENIKTLYDNSYYRKGISSLHGQEIVKMFLSGSSINSIADTFKCTANNISIILKKNNVNVKVRNTHKDLSQEILDYIYKLSFEEKLGTRKIATLIGLNRSMVKRILERRRQC